MKILLSKEDAAAAVSLSVSTINRMVSEGRFPKPVRVGVRVLFRHKDLEEWADKLANNEMPTPTKKRGRPRLAV